MVEITLYIGKQTETQIFRTLGISHTTQSDMTNNEKRIYLFQFVREAMNERIRALGGNGSFRYDAPFKEENPNTPPEGNSITNHPNFSDLPNDGEKSKEIK